MSATLKETERIESGPPGPGRGPMGGGMVGQKAMTFVPSAKRLIRRIMPYRVKAIALVVLAVAGMVTVAQRTRQVARQVRG